MSYRAFRQYTTTIFYNIGVDQIEYMVTDVIRIYPETCEGLACFRMEIIGCDPKGDLKIL